MVRPRIILADDHKMLSEAFGNLLAADYDILESVTNGRDLVDAVKRHKPDLVIADIAMPLLNGLEAGRQIKKEMPEVKLIFLTVNEDPDLAAEAFRCGAKGYVLKNCAVSELIDAIKVVLCGGSYVTPLISGSIIELINRGPKKSNSSKTLTSRQREVLQLLAEGHTMKQVAGILGIKPRTVAFHKYRIMEQHNIKTNAELLRIAAKFNLISL